MDIAGVESGLGAVWVSVDPFVCEGSVVETKHLPPGFGQATVRLSAHDPNALHLGIGTTVGEAERQLIMLSGQITTETTAEALVNDPDAQRRYLGVEPLAEHH